MLATPCRCARPHNFDAETCHRCGRAAPPRVTASTWRIAIAIYETVLGHRPFGVPVKRDPMQRTGGG